jgi:hypothetical protein
MCKRDVKIPFQDKYLSNSFSTNKQRNALNSSLALFKCESHPSDKKQRMDNEIHQKLSNTEKSENKA